MHAAQHANAAQHAKEAHLVRLYPNPKPDLLYPKLNPTC